jgi:uncharacterized membrane protein (DUF373 family)
MRAAREQNSSEARIDVIASTGEIVVYCLIGVVLFVGSVVLVGKSAYDFVDGIDKEGVIEASRQALDTLLLTFIFVELLSATRVIIREKRLVAEPFLLVGIIAAIKELVVLAGTEDLSSHGWEQFRNGMVEIGVVVGVVLLLTICTLLMRRSQRDPSEVDEE